MKVTTDACIFGAWINAENPRHILDIGTGTGLLSLMLAQRYSSNIDAVEIESEAAKQASANFAESPWSDRLNLVTDDIKNFVDSTNQQYDLIISNPPFFTQNLRSDSQNKNLARHSDTLSTPELCSIIAAKLTPQGVAFILFPEYEADVLLGELSNFALTGRESLVIRNSKHSNVLRKVIGIQKDNAPHSRIHNAEFIIKDGDNNYTRPFIKLLSAYYASL